MVLIGALALVAVLALLGTVSIITTSTELIISQNHKTSVQARYVAQAGTEEARARLRGSSSDDSYAGDPAPEPDPTWSAYILTSNTWEFSTDPNDSNYFDPNYKNFIPLYDSVNHTNTATETNTIQTAPDISYWVKIRHKTEADLFPTEQYTDNGSGTNDMVYYGYATPSSTTLEQFTTTDPNPDTGSPVEIITSYGSNGNSSGIIEIQTRKITGPPIVGTIYADSVEGNGNITITGDDNCASADSLPAIAYADENKIKKKKKKGKKGKGATLTSEAGEKTKISSALDMAKYVDALESTATVTLTGDQNNYSIGSSSNYEVVFCDATQLSGDQELDINNLTGYGTLVVRGDVNFGGTINWNGIIVASGNLEYNGSGEIYGTVLAGGNMDLKGTVDIYNDSCKIDNAKSSYRYSTFRWEDKNLIDEW